MESATNALSVGAWVKVESNGQWQAIARKVLQEGAHAEPYSAYDLLVEVVGGIPKARMAVSNSDGNRAVAYGSTALSYGQWHHLVGVYDGAAITIYVDGSQNGSVPFSGALLRTNQPLFMGRNSIGGDIFKGSIDDFRVYSEALHPTEVHSLYNYTGPAPTGLHVVPGS